MRWERVLAWRGSMKCPSVNGAMMRNVKALFFLGGGGTSSVSYGNLQMLQMLIVFSGGSSKKVVVGPLGAECFRSHSPTNLWRRAGGKTPPFCLRQGAGIEGPRLIQHHQIDDGSYKCIFVYAELSWL